MKRFFNFFLSSKATIILLILIAFAMAVATFIEDKYDTVTARIIIYNAKWFELLFLLLIINLIGHIKAYKLISWKKIGGLIFHLAFVVMILGAAITRYFGFEGSMHIRKGETTNIVYSDDTYLIISYADKTKTLTAEHPISVGRLTNNAFEVNLPTEDKGNITVKYRGVKTNVVQKVVEDVAGGKNMIDLSIVTKSGLQNIYISSGEIKNFGKINIAFNNTSDKTAVNIIEQNGEVKIVSPFDIIKTTMTETEVDTIPKDTLSPFKENFVYNINDVIFLYSKFYKSAEKRLVSGTMEEKGVDAVILDVTIKGKTKEADVFNNSSFGLEYENFNFDGTNIKFGFGNKTIELPFSLKLKDFIFEKYPGSESPSSYKSEVVLIDNRYNLVEDHSIYMNHVLDYNQYRFFQSSFDNDEQGTVLSVNHDFWGTIVSYLGYTLLTIGFLITLFNKNSRFLSLRRFIADVRTKRKSTLLTIALIIGINGFAFSQNLSGKIVDKNHAEKFGQLLSQTYDGRFAPVNTLAIDVMHKIAKQENFTIEGKGKLNALQALLDMMVEPELWQKQKIINVPQQEIRDLIGITTENASFIDFFDKSGQYKLEKTINESFQKKQSEKNKFDREVLKVDERLNIFYMIINGSILKIFPEQNSINNKWVGWDDKSAKIPLSGAVSIINADLQLPDFTYANIMEAYIMTVQNAMETGDYSKADKILGYISDIQKQNSNSSSLIKEINPSFIILIIALLSVLAFLLRLMIITKKKIFKYSLLIFSVLCAIFASLIIFDLHFFNNLIYTYSDSFLPSATKIKAEIFYNKADIFNFLKNVYAALSVLLLIFAFIENVRAKKSKLLIYTLNVFTVLLGFAFLYHTLGMGLRWYITDHAPWSNGYEALILVAWGALLAGFSFAKHSKITLAATTLLAFFVLMTAGHSSYDPQLTNLQPVLKSFWLIIHVATLTISYGFLGLGFILGLMNLFIYLFKTKKNHAHLDLLIAENTYIIEMNLIIGLVLATIGTFLGAVWANESWGTYWAWDAKETWALIIVVTYSLVLHMRFIPKFNNKYAFNVASVLAFSSVLMTFIGVNYYLSKGMHSYGAGDAPIFPLWAWIVIDHIFKLIIIVGILELIKKKRKNK